MAVPDETSSQENVFHGTPASYREVRRWNHAHPSRETHEVSDVAAPKETLHTIAEEEKKSLDPSDEDSQGQRSDDEEDAKTNRRRRSVSECTSPEVVELPRRAVSTMTVDAVEPPNFARQNSDQARVTPNLFEKNGVPRRESQDYVDSYYEKNQYTVTGKHDTYNKLPLHLQRRMEKFREQDNQSHVSRNSTPGAFGEPVVPTVRRFDTSFYWLVFNRKRLGFRHIFLLLIVLLYTFFGATVFYFVEGTNEKAMIQEHQEKLKVLILKIAEEMADAVNDPMTNVTLQQMEDYLRDAYIQLQKEENQYKWSTYYKLEDVDHHLKWTYASAFFFCMNVYTTTGYGAISAETALGQAFTIFYGFLFVPITLIVLRDLGQLCLVHITRIYAHALTYWRKLNGEKEIDDDEMISLPIKFCLALLLGYLLFCTTFVYVYDGISGHETNEGISYFLAFYFSFISLSTIGLGDVMPNNVPYAPVISIMFFLGMAITKVVNRNTYITLENGIVGFLTLMEAKLDSLAARKTAPKDVETPKTRPPVSNVPSTDGAPDQDPANEFLNNFTVRSLATFMKSNHDIYGGGFGRVHLRRGDLLQQGGSTDTPVPTTAASAPQGHRQRAASVSVTQRSGHPLHHRESVNF
ncbi:unnamed protein product [Caenorhabditis auriculariae]|uniref:Potassium channel domain-containing protein n=1 Tax=Caenorhabditis auriculariae TaxID=2777116 RepID=A0A8S1GVK1_9PELO|nr:unnamed protein product [Caenorhabditis auriculariae]